MRYLFSIVAIAATFFTSAQELPNLAIGVVQTGNNQELISVPTSTIIIDITLSTTNFTAGTYARYAQKYLGERVPLTDKTSVKAESSNIALAPQGYFIAPESIDTTPTVVVKTPSLSIDKLSINTTTPEMAARNAANEIRTIRKTCRDLVVGDVGEGVFGAGLEVALSRLDKMEREYLSLFMGHEVVTTTTHRFAIDIKPDMTRYMICRYNQQKGFVSADEMDSEPVYLQIIPESVEDSKLPSRNKAAIGNVYITPSRAQCDLYIGADIVNSTTLPLYDFGSRITITAN